MARVQNVLIGRASGSVGNATFSTWKGINVLKAKAESVAQPNTPAQQGQKNRMTLIVSVYRLIAAVILFGYKEQAIKKSEYNAFVSDNIMDAIDLDGSQVATMDYPNLSVSKGTIGDTAITSIASEVGSDLIVMNFDSSLIPVGGNANDTVFGVIYNETTGDWAYTTNNDIRGNGEAAVVFANGITVSDSCHCYLFFYGADGGASSDSVYQAFTVS